MPAAPRPRNGSVHRRRPWLLGAVLILGVPVALLSASAAQAHTELVSSTPSAGERLNSPPARQQLTFSDDINPQLITVTLTVASQSPSRLPATATGPTVTATVTTPAVPPPDAPAATEDWTVTYRVVSADGHPVSGQLTITLAPTVAAAKATDAVATPAPSAAATPPTTSTPPQTTPPATASPSDPAGSASTSAPMPLAAPSAQPQHDEDDVKPIIWLLIGASLWVVIAWFMFIRHRRSRTPDAPDPDAEQRDPRVRGHRREPPEDTIRPGEDP